MNSLRLAWSPSGNRAHHHQPMARCWSRLRLTKTGDMDDPGSGPVEHEIVELAGVIIVEGKGPIIGGYEIVPGDPMAFVDRAERPAGVFQDRHEAGSGPVEQEMVGPAAMVKVEGQGAVAGGFEVVPSNSLAFVDRNKSSLQVLQNRDGPRTWAIEHQVIQLAAVIVVEGKSLAVRALQVVDAGALRRIALRAYRRKGASGVRENFHGSCGGAIEHQMIQLAAVIVIEGKYLIGRGVPDHGVWIACRVFVHRRKDSVAVIPENGDDPCTEPIEREMVLSATVAVVQGDDPVGGGLEIVLREAVAFINGDEGAAGILHKDDDPLA